MLKYTSNLGSSFQIQFLASSFKLPIQETSFYSASIQQLPAFTFNFLVSSLFLSCFHILSSSFQFPASGSIRLQLCSFMHLSSGILFPAYSFLFSLTASSLQLRISSFQFPTWSLTFGFLPPTTSLNSNFKQYFQILG